MKKIVFLSVAVLFLFNIESNAQYRTAIGVRAGWASGISFRHFVSETNAAEFMITNRWGGYIFTGLFEWHNEINKSTLITKQMSWYIGIGGHLGSFKSGSEYSKPDEYHTPYTEDVKSIGADAIIGVEYRFLRAPFAISLDAKPNFSFINSNGDWIDAAFSIRYVFGRR